MANHILHETHNIHPEIKLFHLTYTYDKKINNWKFVGYRCTRCNKLFKNSNTLPKHELTCRGTVINKDLTKLKIINVKGEDWHPYETNQN